MTPGHATAMRAADAESRRLAQCEFALPIAIEAGAGTGKTATLVARVLAWCLGPGWERARARAKPDAPSARIAEDVLRGVVAITFTEAAAAEMDGRIDAALEELARGRRPVGFDADAPEERVVALRGALDQLAVQTIHAWCRRLLAFFPIEAGLHPLFEVDADGTACAAAAREAVRERLGAAYAAGDEDALALAAAGAGPREIEQTLVLQLQAGARSEELAQDPLAPERIGALRRRLADAHAALHTASDGGLGAIGNAASSARAVAASLGAGLAALREPDAGLAAPHEPVVGLAAPLEPVADLAAPLEPDAGLAAPLEPVADAETLVALRARLLAVWEKKSRSKLAAWARGRFAKSESQALGAREAAVAAAAARLSPLLQHVELLDVENLGRMARTLASLAADVEERLRRRGRVTFEMLLSRAAALLHEHPDVAARLRAGIDQLLVDEFQDTDPRQCRIVAALALEGPAATRPGLFVVGDPKQSIYGWRHADLEAYEGLLARMREAGGAVGPLCVNYRSVPAILEEVERVVAPVMQRVPGLQPAFEPLAPCEALERASGFADGGREVVEYWVSAELDEDGAPRRTRSAESAALEARCLARELRELHDRHGVGWSEVGVLFRSRGNWDVYLGALRDAGVPYAVEGDRTYYRRREILDAASLVASILDPNDQVSLVALLRSSVGGVPDAAWIPLWEGRLPALAARLGGAPGALEEIAGLLEKTAEEIADAPGVARIAGWQRVAFACLEGVAALRRSFARDPADVFVERLREILGFELSEAARFLGAWRAANLERFFDDLAASLAAGEPVAVLLRRLRGAMAEDETPSVEPKPPEAADAVTVATLHGAKGLAWGHVYLMQLHKGASNVAARGDLRREDGWLETSWGRWRTLGYDVVEARSRQVSEAERVRTLYVGMTRAQRRLVLCGLRPEVQEASRESHATLLESRAPAPPALEVLAREAAAHGGAIRAAGARWVFPARVLAEESGCVVAEPEAPASLEARATPPLAFAAARMALPRGVSVSSLAEGTETEREAREAEGDDARPGSPAGALAARCVGTAIHAALERLDLEAERAPQWASARGRIEAAVRAAAPAGLRERAQADALACWDALGEGPLAAALFALGTSVVARELPILLSPEGLGAAPVATGYVSGAIDLLYRDASGRLVVADYKTDRTLPEADADARTRYVRQGALYCRAVAEALRPEVAPRFEIWWLRHGVVDRVDALPASPSQLRLTF